MSASLMSGSQCGQPDFSAALYPDMLDQQHSVLAQGC